MLLLQAKTTSCFKSPLGKLLLIYICIFHVLSHLLLIYICKLHWNLNRAYTSPKNIFIEGDASSASYFLAGAAITGGTVTVFGCGSESIQGDARFAGEFF